jgi:DNA-directed RNA polymerase specialized sigma24 family protein
VKRSADEDFECFFREYEPELRRALFASLGIDRGREATAEAMAWAWEHWSRVRKMDNPVGYLFRVGQSRTRSRKSVSPTFVRDNWSDPLVEPKLGSALGTLTEHQRMAVVLVHGFGWTLREVGSLYGVKVTSVQNHLERGILKLRKELGYNDDRTV